ncbi:vitamin K-dependent protein C-like [Armigeres subalbatus]|uniref:vitamin K-dependent protein C-like n=1 Tax=Armigeres subalbatus TaxID=124917 RepID=UPI002ED0A22A
MKCFLLATAILCVLGAQAAPDRTARIFGGEIAHHQPYNAYILYVNAANAGFFGGGTIISDRHIITSARNIEGFSRWDIGVGSNVFAHLSIISSTRAIQHPSFNAANRVNDIGIIELPSSLVFTTSVAPVALPPLSAVDTNNLPYENEQGSIVGFGFTTELSTGQASFLKRAFQRVVANTRCSITNPQAFCAEDADRATNICVGDIGAGFITEVRGQPTLTGIASNIVAMCSNTNPTEYTRVESHRSWINNHTQV